MPLDMIVACGWCLVVIEAVVVAFVAVSGGCSSGGNCGDCELVIEVIALIAVCWVH